MQLYRKHYNAIAEALYKAMPTNEQHALEQWEHLVEDIARIVSEGNAQFSYGIFRKACGKTNK